MARITSEDFLSLSAQELQKAQEHIFFLLGSLDALDTPEIQRAIRRFYHHIKSEVAAGAARAGEQDAPREGPRDAAPSAEFPPLTEDQICHALYDLAFNGVVFLECEEHAKQVFDATEGHTLADELVSYSGSTVTLSRAS